MILVEEKKSDSEFLSYNLNVKFWKINFDKKNSNSRVVPPRAS
jgi:hypothetical protein